MNIAHLGPKIPDLHHVRICSKHFLESEFQYLKSNCQKSRKLLGHASPTDWRNVYPEDVEMVMQKQNKIFCIHYNFLCCMILD
jgi:hypothetical protein